MTEERSEELEDIYFAWQMKGQMPASRNKRYEKLRHLNLQKGHCEVLSKYSQNAKRYRWVDTQRVQYMLMKEVKASTMSAYKIEALELIGFTYKMISGDSPRWKMRNEELKSSSSFRKDIVRC